MKKSIGVLSIIAVTLVIILDAITARAPAGPDMGYGLEKGYNPIADMKEKPMDEVEGSGSRDNGTRVDGSGGNDTQNRKGECHDESFSRANSITGSGIKESQHESEDKNDAPNPPADKYYLTFEEIMEIKNISLMDKIMGMAILGKLGREKVEKLVELAGGGITMKELEGAKQLLEESLGKEELEKLMDIFERNKEALLR